MYIHELNTELFADTNFFADNELFADKELLADTVPFVYTDLFVDTELFADTKLFANTALFVDTELFADCLFSNDMLKSWDEKSTCPSNDLTIPGFLAPDQLPDETTASDIRDLSHEVGPLLFPTDAVSDRCCFRPMLFPTDDPLAKTERLCPRDMSFYLCCICDARMAFYPHQDCLPSKCFGCIYCHQQSNFTFLE